MSVYAERPVSFRRRPERKHRPTFTATSGLLKKNETQSTTPPSDGTLETLSIQRRYSVVFLLLVFLARV
jgi:hypothetical protein